MNSISRFIGIVFTGIFILFLIAIYPESSWSFVEGACGEGICSDCHSITIEEAREALKGVVQSVESVDFAEVPGLFAIEAINNNKKGVLYLDFSKQFIISGNAYRIANKENITRTRLRSNIRVDLTTVPLDDAIVLGNPKAKKKIIVFTDPQCPWCKKLHPELVKIVKKDPSVVFFIKLYPIASLHPDAVRISKSIICTGSLEMLEKSFADENIPDPGCETDAVDRNIKLAKSIGIISTPSMVLPNGRLLEGFRPADKILELISNPDIEKK